MSSDYSSDGDMEEGLNIKPPQAETRDRHRHHRSSKTGLSRRPMDRGSGSGSSSSHRSRHEGDYRQGSHRRERERVRLEEKVSRHSTKLAYEEVPHSSKRRHTRPKPYGYPEDKSKELIEKKKRRIDAELEEDRIFKEIERRREKERRDEQKKGKKVPARHEESIASTSPLSSPEPQRPSKSEKSKSAASAEPEGDEEKLPESLHAAIEVEDIGESSSELEEGEEKSPPVSHSDISASEDENIRDGPKVEDNGKGSGNRTDEGSSSGSSSSASNSEESSISSDEEEASVEKEKSKRPEDDPPEDKPVEKEEPVEEPPQQQEEVEELLDLESLLPPYYPALQGCRSVEEFSLLNRIEEGTYGVVYRAKDKKTGEVVALKRLKMEKEKDGFPITSLREINTLLKAQHENVVTVREIVIGSNVDKIFLCMDFAEHDLKSLMETLKARQQTFTLGEVKCLMVQLLKAVAHLHDNWILHRDLKTSNLLLNHKGILKVGDFGLAREYGSPLKQYTPIVVTLWYRAPELLLGTKEYSTPIDMWSVGCIFGELLKLEPMFQGKSEANQLNLIFETLGTPNDKIWPGYSQMPLLSKITFATQRLNKLKIRYNMLSERGLDLLNKFLTFNPEKRATAEDALSHHFFKEAPLPIDPTLFPTWPAKSEMGHRKAAASPKPPPGANQFKDEDEPAGFFLGEGQRRTPIGAGFSLKF
ncbi:unnamed protein product [Orchesella dallaii]|uniref:Protein kinase domain-containing protein n=1 Tax=Orchesella dallaii TaxID=48710 RepID=A0ABP1PPW0_9HEXA